MWGHSTDVRYDHPSAWIDAQVEEDGDRTGVAPPPPVARRGWGRPARIADHVAQLRSGLDALRSEFSDTVISARKPLNSLLELWAQAETIDHLAAVPLEDLMTRLVHRSAATGAEVAACADEVEKALAELC